MIVWNVKHDRVEGKSEYAPDRIVDSFSYSLTIHGILCDSLKRIYDDALTVNIQKWFGFIVTQTFSDK